MNLKTFYRIYYRHRYKKASFLLKPYLLITALIKYIYNLFYFPKKIDLDVFATHNNFLFQKDLNFLFEYFNSDKGNFFTDQYSQPHKKDNIKKKAHSYSKFYEHYFKDIRNNNLNIIEIGSFYGNASAALFFYFKNSNIFGADINPDMFLYKSKRVNNFFLNNSKRELIEKNLKNKKVEFDIIIEDASHMLKDQVLTLFMYFKLLKPGGIFIIEEIDFPEKYLNMRENQEPPDLKSILKNVLEKKDFSSKYVKDEEKTYFLNNYKSIDFFKGNFNEIVFIKKNKISN